MASGYWATKHAIKRFEERVLKPMGGGLDDVRYLGLQNVGATLSGLVDTGDLESTGRNQDETSRISKFSNVLRMKDNLLVPLDLIVNRKQRRIITATYRTPGSWMIM